MFGRETTLRQGDILEQQVAISLGLFEVNECATKRAMIISHDCDLASNQESYIEVIVGEIIACVDGKYTGARHPRLIHLTFFDHSSKANIFVAFSQVHKKPIHKENIEITKIKADLFKLSSEEKRFLRQWLAARYARPAFPTNFENRLKKNVTKKSNIESSIAKIIGENPEGLVGVFIDLHEHRDKELPNGEPYCLSIYIIYDGLNSIQVIRETAESLAKKLEQIFIKFYGMPDVADEISLEKCIAVSDVSMSFSAIMKLDQWRIEYLSFMEDPPGKFISVGTLSR